MISRITGDSLASKPLRLNLASTEHREERPPEKCAVGRRLTSLYSSLERCSRLGFSGAFNLSRERYAGRNRRSLAGDTSDPERSAAGERPLPEPHQAKRGSSVTLLLADTTSIVAHLEYQTAVFQCERDGSFARSGVASDVGERFLHHSEDRGRATVVQLQLGRLDLVNCDRSEADRSAHQCDR